eukprot:g1544.t1
MYHAEGTFSRNNGEKTGYNRGGLQEVFLHPQCTFRYAPAPPGSAKQRAAKCSGCGQQTSEGRRALTCFGAKGARCTMSSSGPSYYCFKCTKDFVQRHDSLLLGYLGVGQAEANVAWAVPLRSSPFAAAPDRWGGGPPPRSQNKDVRKEYLQCFRLGGEEDERAALKRHAELQAVISSALAEDRELARQAAAAAAAEPPAKRPRRGAAGVAGVAGAAASKTT